MKPVAVLGATGAVGGRFVEVVAGQERAPLRALVHRWWHTGRIVRFPIELRSAPALAAGASADDLAAVLDGCEIVVSAADGPQLDSDAASVLATAAGQAGVRRLVHIGCVVPDGRRQAFEDALLEAGAAAGVEVTIVAAGLVYGPFTEAGAHEPYRQAQRGRVAVGEGSGRCPLVYVDDLVEAVWTAAVSPEPVPSRLQALGPDDVTWVDFYDAFGRIVGRPASASVPDAELRSIAALDEADRDALRWPPVASGGERLLRGLRRRVGMPAAAAPPRRRLVVPGPDALAAQRAHVDPTVPSAATIGWTPAVGFDEGMRRTGAYLEWAEPAP